MQFLRDLKENNDREWFAVRKPIYEEQVRRPMQQLVEEVASECRRRGFPLFARERNPVTRIYRDIRFSSDKTPFHTFIGAAIRSTPGKESLGEVYIHISPGESFLAGGFWMPERPFLQLWREAMARDADRFAAVVAGLRKHKLELMAEHTLTRMPRGFEQFADTPLSRYFKLTCYVVSRPLQPAEYSSPALVRQAADFALATRPVLEFGWRLKYSPRKDLLDERR